MTSFNFNNNNLNTAQPAYNSSISNNNNLNQIALNSNASKMDVRIRDRIIAWLKQWNEEANYPSRTTVRQAVIYTLLNQSEGNIDTLKGTIALLQGKEIDISIFFATYRISEDGNTFIFKNFNFAQQAKAQTLDRELEQKSHLHDSELKELIKKHFPLFANEEFQKKQEELKKQIAFLFLQTKSEPQFLDRSLDELINGSDVTTEVNLSKQWKQMIKLPCALLKDYAAGTNYIGEELKNVSIALAEQQNEIREKLIGYKLDKHNNLPTSSRTLKQPIDEIENNRIKHYKMLGTLLVDRYKELQAACDLTSSRELEQLVHLEELLQEISTYRDFLARCIDHCLKLNQAIEIETNTFKQAYEQQHKNKNTTYTKYKNIETQEFNTRTQTLTNYLNQTKINLLTLLDGIYDYLKENKKLLSKTEFIDVDWLALIDLTETPNGDIKTHKLTKKRKQSKSHRKKTLKKGEEGSTEKIDSVQVEYKSSANVGNKKAKQTSLYKSPIITLGYCLESILLPTLLENPHFTKQHVKEIKSHLFFAAVGLEVLTQAIEKGISRAWIATVPMILLDIGASIEQLINWRYSQLHPSKPLIHSLCTIAKEAAIFESLSSTTRGFLSEVDALIIWARYTKSSQHSYRTHNKELPAGLKLLISSLEDKPNDYLDILDPFFSLYRNNLKAIKEIVTLSLDQTNQDLIKFSRVMSDLESLLNEQKGTIKKTNFNFKQIGSEHTQQQMIISFIKKIIDLKKSVKLASQPANIALEEAQAHLQRLHVLLSMKDDQTSVHGKVWILRSSFNIQLAIEQLLAAFLLANGKSRPLTHHLAEYLSLLPQEHISKKLKQAVLHFSLDRGGHYPYLYAHDHEWTRLLRAKEKVSRKYYDVKDGFIPKNFNKDANEQIADLNLSIDKIIGMGLEAVENCLEMFLH